MAINSTVSVIVAYVIGTATFGNFFGMDLGVNALHVNYPLLIGAILLGVVAFSFLGLLLCAISLLSYKIQYSLSEYTTGIMFLLSGVVFPVSMLPVVVQQMSYMLPSTYFLNLVRLALSNSNISFMNDLIFMILTTVGFSVIAMLLFKLAEHRATALIIIFVLSITALYGMGILFASLFLLYGREATHIADVLQEPIYVLSGMYYPVLSSKFFPFTIKLLASAIPLTLGIDGMRQILVLGGDLISVIPHIVGLLILVSILLPFSYFSLQKMEAISKREGRLTLRWQ